MTNTVCLDKDEVLTILEIMKDNDLEIVKVTGDSSSGIGQTTKVTFSACMSKWNAEVTIDITDVGKW